ncbi:hypothetical protein DFJ74DRAFT_683878 [Hyaloraphidium curvatum]|nr:hypothetical protein DFJ74DRAFT_683878 [Hyaloraphidium curvatum]
MPLATPRTERAGCAAAAARSAVRTVSRSRWSSARRGSCERIGARERSGMRPVGWRLRSSGRKRRAARDGSSASMSRNSVTRPGERAKDQLSAEADSTVRGKPTRWSSESSSPPTESRSLAWDTTRGAKRTSGSRCSSATWSRCTDWAITAHSLAETVSATASLRCSSPDARPRMRASSCTGMRPSKARPLSPCGRALARSLPKPRAGVSC